MNADSLQDAVDSSLVKHGHERWTLGKMQNPVRGFLHGSGALVSVVGLIWLLVNNGGGVGRIFALAVFGASLIVLYTTSTIYHTVPWREAWKKRMQRLDHTAIFLLVAGTYTPMAAIVLDGWLRWGTLAMAWTIAAIGIAQLHFFPRQTTGLAIALYMILGWLAVLLAYPMAQRLPWPALLVMLVGGLQYSIGMVFLVTNRPKLWPRVFSYHELFHVLVIGGSLAHYIVTARYVVHYPIA